MTNNQVVIAAAEMVGWKVLGEGKVKSSLTIRYPSGREYYTDEVDLHQLLMLAVLFKKKWGVHEHIDENRNAAYCAAEHDRKQIGRWTEITHRVAEDALPLAVLRAAVEKEGK